MFASGTDTFRVVGTSKSMDDHRNSTCPGEESAKVDAVIIPVWATRGAIIERRDVNIALADEKVINAGKVVSISLETILRVSIDIHHDGDQRRNERDI